MADSVQGSDVRSLRDSSALRNVRDAIHLRPNPHAQNPQITIPTFPEWAARGLISSRSSESPIAGGQGGLIVWIPQSQFGGGLEPQPDYVSFHYVAYVPLVLSDRVGTYVRHGTQKISYDVQCPSRVACDDT